MSTLADAITSLAPAARFTFKDEDLSTLVWLDTAVARPTDAEIIEKQKVLKAELPMKMLRMERNRRLAECDWTQSADVPVNIKNAWTAYRQALRDITNTYSSLDDVVWPTKPE